MNPQDHSTFDTIISRLTNLERRIASLESRITGRPNSSFDTPTPQPFTRFTQKLSRVFNLLLHRAQRSPSFDVAVSSLVVFAAIFLLNVYIKRDDVLSQLLFADDLIIFPKSALFDQPFVHRFLPVQSFIYSQSAALLKDAMLQKLFYLTLHSASGVFLLHTFRRYFASTFSLAVFIIIALTSFFTEQMVTFVNGSHPVLGLFFATLAMLIGQIAVTRSTNYPIRFTLAVLAGILYIASVLSSGMFYLVFLAPIVWLLLIRQIEPSRRYIYASVVGAQILVPIMFLVYYVASRANYFEDSQDKGLTRYSTSNAFAQVESLLSFIVDSATSSINWLDFIFIGLICGLAVGGFLAFRHRGARTKSIPPTVWNSFTMVLSLLVIGGLLSGAFIVSTSFASRYIYAASVFGFLVVAVFADRQMVNRTVVVRNAIYVGLAVLLAYNVALSRTAHQLSYAEPIAYQRLVMDLIEIERDMWPEDAQVVIVDVDPLPTLRFTGGFNHWSTWFVRFVTGREDIIGLIGSAAQTDQFGDPFVDEWTEFGPENFYFVQHRGGQSIRRRKMVGLLTDRPLFVYETDLENRTWKKYGWLAVSEENGAVIVYSADGTEPAQQVIPGGHNYWAGAKSLGIALSDVYTYGTMQVPVLVEDPPDFEAFDGTRVITNAVAEQRLLSSTIEILLKSARDESRSYQFSETSPPMPLLASSVALYQTTVDTYSLHIRTRDSVATPVRIANADMWRHLAVTIDEKNEAIVYLDGVPVATVQDAKSLSGTMNIGKGFLERAWTGSVSYVRVSEGIRYADFFVPPHSVTRDATTTYLLSTDETE